MTIDKVLRQQEPRATRPDIERAAHAVSEFIDALGLDLSEEALANTPSRMARAYSEFLRVDHFEATQFENTAGFTGLVVLNAVTFRSLCEHHLLPFTGTVALRYAPGKRLLGLSKLARIVRERAARPQLQERLTQEILMRLVDSTTTAYAQVVVQATHACVTLRGVSAESAVMETIAVHGSQPSNTEKNYGV